MQTAETINTVELGRQLSFKNFDKLLKLKVKGERNKRSRKYKRIDSLQLVTQIFNTLQAAGHTNVSLTIKRRHGNSTAHCLEFTLHDSVALTDGGMKPKIIVFNSYDGECRCVIGIGIFRFVCSNGLMMGTNYFQELITHINGPTADRKLAGIEHGIAAALQNIEEELATKVAELQAISIGLSRAIEVVESMGFSIRLTTRIRTKLVELWFHQVGRTADQPQNLWTLFNIVNEQINRNSRSEYAQAELNKQLLNKLQSALETIAV